MLGRASLAWSVASSGTTAEISVLARLSAGSGFDSVDGFTGPELEADVQGLLPGGMIGKCSGGIT